MASATSPTSTDGRDETAEERLDRNTMELLNELRVAGTGIQVMFAFLLVVPFNTGWRHVSTFGRATYFVTLLCVAIAAVLLIAPSIQHRILFRHGEKRYLVQTANQLAIAAMVFLTAGFTGILVLVTDVVVGGAAPWIVGFAFRDRDRRVVVCGAAEADRRRTGSGQALERRRLG